MYRQFFFNESTDKLKHVVSATEYFSDKILGYDNLFRRNTARKILLNIILSVGIFFIKVLEKIIGTKLYVSNNLREFFAIDPRIRKLILFLLKKNIISSWARLPCAPDQPPIVYYSLYFKPIRLSSGNSYTLQGSAAGGSGETSNKALIPTIAEAFERYSASKWDPRDIIRGSFNELRSRGAVDPRIFNFFTEKQRYGKEFFKFRFDDIHSRKMGWVRSKSLSGASCLIPAELVYIFYQNEHPQEPCFWETTTNGVAAATSFEEAAYKAICEAIERDSFFVFWLNKIAPPQINLENISIPEVKEKIALFKKYNLNPLLLDITTDLEVPAVALFIIDHIGEVAVSFSAAADFNIDVAIKKVFYTTGIRLQIPVSQAEKDTIKKKYSDIKNIEDRRVLWSRKEMLPQLDFFLQGEKKPFIKKVIPFFQKNSSALNNLNFLKSVLKKKGYACYLADITSLETRHVGLKVVRAIMPALVPLYFDEEKKYLGVQRIYTAPVDMGYYSAPREKNDLNDTPHPFL
ncbi:MAG: YcaO-like family protein [bacterium]|nr:YcaO-like family protein [bacterium]